MMKIKLKNVCWSCLAFFTLAVGCVFLIMSCKTKTDFKELVNIPTMQDENIENSFQPKNYIDRHTIGQHFSMQKSANQVPTKVPTDFKVIMLDTRYRQVDYFHFLAFNNWFKNLCLKQDSTGIGKQSPST